MRLCGGMGIALAIGTILAGDGFGECAGLDQLYWIELDDWAMAIYIIPNATTVRAIHTPASALNSGSFHIKRARGVLANHPARNPPAIPPTCAQKSTPGRKLSTRP